MNSALFFIGIYVTLSIYHLLIFAGRRHDLSNLLFTFFCSCYSFFLYWNSIYKYSSSYEYILFHFIYALTCVVFAVIFIFLPYTIFNMKRIKGFSIILSCIIVIPGISTSLLFQFSGNVIFLRLLYFMLFLGTLLYLCITIYTLLFKMKIKNKNELIILTGYTLLSVFLLIHTGILTLYLEITPSLITRIFFIIMAFTFSYSLTKSINKEHYELLLLKDSLEQKVRERTRQLEEAKEQQETFFINIAHEIKTPLTIVTNSFSDFYKSSREPGNLQPIQAGLEKMKRDIVNFLDLHKLQSGKPFYNHEKIINCSQMLKEAVLLFKQAAEKKDIHLEVSVDLDELYTKIDPFAFNRIINNLLENSLKYNNPGGRVSVILKKTGNSIVLDVSDTGIGIPEKVIGNIFYPYYQVSHKKRNIQGLGMGLAIVKGICNDIRAGISVKSRENEGTRITVRFMNHEIGAADVVSTDKDNHFFINGSTIPVQAEDTRYCFECSSILLVEDNEDLLGFLYDKLKDNYNVYCARNGKEGLEKIGHIKNLDIIISDIMMDQMDGQTFRANIVKDNTYSAVPFIFLTAKLSHQTRLQCLADGAIDYIVKPFSIDELLYKIAALIKMRKSLSKQNLEEVERLVNRYLKDTLKKQADKLYDTGDRYLYTQHGISDQEIRVISMLKQGLLYKEIAANLNVSINSVRSYVRRIHKKLKIQSTAQLFEILS